METHGLVKTPTEEGGIVRHLAELMHGTPQSPPPASSPVAQHSLLVPLDRPAIADLLIDDCLFATKAIST